MSLCHKVGLGTVQWGMPYGIANTSGPPDSNELVRMLRLARKAGICLLDTAHGYGNAEGLIGQHKTKLGTSRIVTKTLPMRSKEFDGGGFSVLSHAFEESLKRLNCSSVYGLLVHRTEDLLADDSDILWSGLQSLKSRGSVAKIGVSLYTPKQLEQILDRYPIDLVQLPFNLYDQRFLQNGLSDRLKSTGVEIHARSTFLQGLLLVAPEQLPNQFECIREHHASLHRTFEKGGVSPLTGCLHFCLQQSWIDHVIVGCETSDQLFEILEAAERSVSLEETKKFALNEESIINPARWRL